MPNFLRENSASVFFSLLLHGLLVAALVLSARFSFTHASHSAEVTPVFATVISSQILHAAAQEQADAQARAAAEAKAAADAKAAAEASAAAAAQAAEDHEEAQKEAAQRAAAEAKQAESAKAAADAARVADAARAVEAKQALAAKQAATAKQLAQAKAAAEAKAAADGKAAAEAKAAADAKAAAEAKATAEAKQAAEAKRAADARAKADREAELRRQIADEEHASQIEAGPLGDQYKARLQSRITHAWIKPESARPGIDCTVEVTQIPGGEVTKARVLQCNGDAAVRQSIENAVYRASPLPDPPDPSLFHRVFVIEFTPNE